MEHGFEPFIYRRPLPFSITPLLGDTPRSLAPPAPADAVQTGSEAPPAEYRGDVRIPRLVIDAATGLPAPGETEFVPPLATRPMPLRPEAVERMVFAVASAHPVAGAAAVTAPVLPTRALEGLLSRAEYGRPHAATRPMPLRPEAAERMVFAIGSAHHVAAAANAIAPVLATLASQPLLSRAEYGRPLQVSTAPVTPAHASPAATFAAACPAHLRLPDLQIAAAEPYLAPVPVPQTRNRWTAIPAVESVYASPAAGAADATSTEPSLPKFQVEPFEPSLEPVPISKPRTRWTPAPGAEPVHALPAPEVAEAAMVRPWLPKFQVVPFEPGLASTPQPRVRERWTPASASQPVPASPGPSAADPAAAQPRLPKFQVPPADVCLEPVPVPQACNEWMPNLSAEPVCIEVLAISVPESIGVPEAWLPGIHIFSVTDPWMPVSLHPKPPLTAEPVSMRVWPKTATAALPAYDELPEPGMPDGRELLAAGAGATRVSLAPAAHGLAAEPAERMVFPLCEPALVPACGAQALQMPAFVHRQMKPAAHLAGAAPGLPAEPVETMPSCGGCRPAPVSVTPELQLPRLAQPQTKDPGIDDVNVVIMPGVRPSRPAAAAHTTGVEPLRTLFVVPPEPYRSEPPAATVVARGFVPLDFHCQRSSGAPTGGMAWCAPVNRPTLPGMGLPIIVERTEETAPQKPTQDHPAFTAIFRLPEVARKKAGNAGVRYAIRALAACLVLGAILWFGMGALQLGNQTPAVSRDISFGDMAANSPSRSLSPAAGSPLAGSPRAAAAPRGAMARIRTAISDRAAASMTDSFRTGMEAWGAATKQWAPGWSRHPDGYVQTGQMALFHPSLGYKDYHLEFFGQIESKSMGWAVRATNTDNYYAMKLKVIEPGLRPVIAMVHYPVVAGKKGRPVEIPLNVMVHNSRPMQVEVDVRGNKLLTSVDGQLVDTWIDDTLVAGGVGFFSEAGERARLYWMKISKNEDFLGRICAYVANTLGDGSRASADLWPDQIPTPTPQPQPLPERTQEAALAATAAELQNRVTKASRREKWNS
ncbi:MAG: hypothetical protein P4L56_01950 [Candidatus Sulfopaludibacter sp.]|nr:hypothetical protein [Candidatus Sulfopaludibacter sp.]